MAQLNDTMVQGDLRVTGKIYGTDNAIHLDDANLAIPTLGAGDNVGSAGDFFIGSGSGKNLPDTTNNFNIHTTVTHLTGTTYRLSQIATPTSSNNPSGIYERGGSSSDGATWTFGSWVSTTTDTNVTQTKDDSGTTAYPLLMAGAADPNGTATTARYDSGVKLTPSTNTISANISGNAATASAAQSGSALETAINGKASTSHAHGNIASGGTLTDTAAAAAGNDYVVIRDADNAKIQTSTIKGTDVADAVSKKHSHSTLTLSTTAQAYDGSHTLALPSTDPYTSARTPASHTHGNITNAGTITADTAIASGTKIATVGTDNKVSRSPISFDGSTTTTALTPKGTFEAFAKSGDITSAINALDVSSVGGAGKYISAISETDGKISATATTMDTEPTASSTNAVTSGGVKTALDLKANGVRWTAVTKGQTWSRLFLSTPKYPSIGSNGILAVSCTRTSVVCNATFLITASHTGGNTSNIIELASCNYTQVRSRIVVNTSGEYYFEVYDTARDISSSTTQTWRCSFVPLLEATITAYTAFTDGTTVPTGYTATNDFTTTGGHEAAAIKNITRSYTTFTATRQDGSTFTFTQQDTRVNATEKTDENHYKILAAIDPNHVSGNATEAVYDTDISIVPSMNLITANISGNAVTAGRADTSGGYDPAYTGENSIKDALDTKLDADDLDQISLSSAYLASDQRLVLSDVLFDNIYPVVGNYRLAVFNDAAGNNLNPDAIETSGDIEWALDWRPYLVDMTARQGETAKVPLAELKKDNWLRKTDGSYATVCCVKAAQLQSLDGKQNSLVWGNASHHSTAKVAETVTGAYSGDTFSPETFWEYVKENYAAVNTAAGTSYTCGIEVEVYDGSHTFRYAGYSKDGTDHIPAPWEATDTNLSIFIGRTKDCYVVDGYSETTGEYIRGLAAKPVEVGSRKFDPEFFRLKRTGISPGPSTLVSSCVRNFFYNYAGADASTYGNTGSATTDIFYNNGTYPRVNMSQYSNVIYARNCNYGGSAGKAVPVGEGGFHALNAFLCSIEAAFGTRNLWSADRFSAGVSSNYTANAENGGCKVNGTFYTWSSNAVTIQGTANNLASQVNGQFPMFQCMEPQIAASLAVEMGIAGDTGFYWNEGDWHYHNVSGYAGLGSGHMSCRMYKTTREKTINSNTVQCYLVCALVEGVNPVGDIWCYYGGGGELVYETTGTTSTAYKYSFYFEPDQDKWITGSYATSAHSTGSDYKNEKHTDNTKFLAETQYTPIVTDSTEGGHSSGYTNGRIGYTPIRRVPGNSNEFGECCYQYKHISDDGYGAAGIRTRRAMRYRGNCSSNFASSRFLNCTNRPSQGGNFLGCAAQVLLA